MPPRSRSSAATLEPKNTPVPPPSPDPPDPPLIDDPVSGEEDQHIEFMEYLKKLDQRIVNKSTVYVYRTQPKIQKVGNKNIATYPARIFDLKMLEDDHGGGSYKLMLDTGDKNINITRYETIAGSAKIFPDMILVDNDGNPLPPPSAAAADGPASKSDLAEILKTVLDRVQQKSVSTTDAVSELASLYKNAAATAVEIGTAGVKAQLNNPQGGNGAVALLLREVLNELKESRKQDPRIERLYTLALEKMINPTPPPPAPDMFESLRKLADLSSLEELGPLKKLFGGGGDSFWEGIGKDLFSSLSAAVRDNAPALVQWMRERAHFQYVTTMAQRQAAGAAAPNGPTPTPVAVPVPQPPPVPARPAITPPHSDTPSPGSQPPISTEGENMLAAIQLEITSLIKRCWDRSRQLGDSVDGYSAASIVKLAFPAVLPFIRANFSDLGKLRELAAKDPVLSPIASDPDFPTFAQDFFEELHNVDGAEPQTGEA
jgi:hypothetical protein